MFFYLKVIKFGNDYVEQGACFEEKKLEKKLFRTPLSKLKEAILNSSNKDDRDLNIIAQEIKYLDCSRVFYFAATVAKTCHQITPKRKMGQFITTIAVFPPLMGWRQIIPVKINMFRWLLCINNIKRNKN